MAELTHQKSNKTGVFILKLFLVLLATGLSTVVFGLCIPFTMLAFYILPHIGLGGIVYLIIGGVIGLLFGAISSAVSLFKSNKIVTPYYIILMSSLAVLSVLYLFSYFIFYEAYSHI